MTCETKTICFAAVSTISSTQGDILLPTKTNCFGIMMIYDAFIKRVISDNKLITNNLASIMMLF